ncbi:hypothetical protein BDW59DRAFT_146139, partial [Aspergillus cavernicola]
MMPFRQSSTLSYSLLASFLFPLHHSSSSSSTRNPELHFRLGHCSPLARLHWNPWTSHCTSFQLLFQPHFRSSRYGIL